MYRNKRKFEDYSLAQEGLHQPLERQRTKKDSSESTNNQPVYRDIKECEEYIRYIESSIGPYLHLKHPQILLCREKLKEAYDFKSSYYATQLSKGSSSKKSSRDTKYLEKPNYKNVGECREYIHRASISLSQLERGNLEKNASVITKRRECLKEAYTYLVKNSNLYEIPPDILENPVEEPANYDSLHSCKMDIETLNRSISHYKSSNSAESRRLLRAQQQKLFRALKYFEENSSYSDTDPIFNESMNYKLSLFLYASSAKSALMADEATVEQRSTPKTFLEMLEDPIEETTQNVNTTGSLSLCSPKRNPNQYTPLYVDIPKESARSTFGASCKQRKVDGSERSEEKDQPSSLLAILPISISSTPLNTPIAVLNERFLSSSDARKVDLCSEQAPPKVYEATVEQRKVDLNTPTLVHPSHTNNYLTSLMAQSALIDYKIDKDLLDTTLDKCKQPEQIFESPKLREPYFMNN